MDDKKNKAELFSLLLAIISIIAIICLFILFVIKFKLTNITKNSEQYLFYINLKNIFLILNFILIFINSGLLILIVLNSNQEEDYNKYRNYIFISKDKIKNYQNIIKYQNKKIKTLEKKLKNS